MWTKERYESIRQELTLLAEEGYRQFHERLLCSELSVLGVRVPLLRKMAKEIAKEDGIGFLSVCGRKTHEERLLYGLVAAALPLSYEEKLLYWDYYAKELAENWAHCDVFCSAVKGKYKGQEKVFFDHIGTYLESENPWTVRVGLVMMLSHYLTEEYFPEVLERTETICSSHYYVRMAQAWLLATAWAKDRNRMKAYVERHQLGDWVFRKFVQKSCGSYRVSKEDKAFLRSFL